MDEGEIVYGAVVPLPPDADRATLRVLARVYGKATRRLPAVAGGASGPR
jgi:hypothetical protein